MLRRLAVLFTTLLLAIELGRSVSLVHELLTRRVSTSARRVPGGDHRTHVFVHPTGSDPTSNAISSLLARVGDEMPPSQMEALQDSQLTYSEYERAFQLTIQCMRDEGMQVRGPVTENNGRYLTYSFTSSDSEADARCYREHLSYIHPVWVDSQIPTGAEAERVRTDYSACVREVGLLPPTDAALATLERFVGDSLRDPQWGNNRALDACIREYSNAIFSNDP